MSLAPYDFGYRAWPSGRTEAIVVGVGDHQEAQRSGEDEAHAASERPGKKDPCAKQKKQQEEPTLPITFRRLVSMAGQSNIFRSIIKGRRRSRSCPERIGRLRRWNARMQPGKSGRRPRPARSPPTARRSTETGEQRLYPRGFTADLLQIETKQPGRERRADQRVAAHRPRKG